MNPPLPFPYAPTRKTPLSLWSPLDYLQLLYWVFYFPQALRWYVETFGNLPFDTNGREAFRNDSIQRKLVIQGLFLLLTVLVLLATSLRWFEIPIDKSIAKGIALGIALGIVWGIGGGIARGIAFGIAFGIVWGIAWSIAKGIALDIAWNIAFGITFGIAWSIARGIVGGIAFGIVWGITFGIVWGIAFGIAWGIVGGIARGITGDTLVDIVWGIARGIAELTVAGIASSILWGINFSIAFSIAFGIATVRSEAMILTFPLAMFARFRSFALRFQRVSLVPLLGLRDSLVRNLSNDWERGIRECEGLLRYSLQFVSISVALEETLQRLSSEQLLARVASWCSLPLHDWQVVRFQSASLWAALKNKFWDGLLIVPRRWRPHAEENLRYDTPARAACAGFWHLHEKEPDKAVVAFAVVHQLQHGEELYNNARTFAAAFTCENLEQIGNWQQPVLKVDTRELLRPQVHAAFVQLANIAQEISLVQHSRSTRQRNSALNRASGLLNALPTQLADCPTPERALFMPIAEQWLKIVLDSASAVGTLEVREVVASPYIVGAPLPANRLTGRQDIFDQISAMWAKPGQRDSLVIFGHRRMGKSSIARNVQHFCMLGDNTSLAALNLQSVDFSHGLGDLCYALAFRLWEAAPTLFDEPQIEEYQAHPLPALRRLLATLDRKTPQPRCILILDEYELIDEKLSPTAANDFVMLLRGLTQQYPWLTMALVGLHSLEERSASFYQAIYAWRPIRVGLMNADAVAEVLQVEDDAFPLEYSLEAVAHAHALTGGQPFLVQLLGDSLVQRFNQQLRQQLDPPSPTFSAADVDAVVADPQFYQQGSIYFRGIWSQANENPFGQQAILQRLAPHEVGLDRTALQSASSLESAVFNAALEALQRHDVVTVVDGRCCYAVELMRRWVISNGGQDSNSINSEGSPPVALAR